MPMNPVLEYPDYNGMRYSRTSCDFRWDGVKINLWKSLSHKAPLKPGKTWGNMMAPQGRTNGKFDPSAECELLMEEFVNLRTRLSIKAKALGMGYKQVSSLITFSAFEPLRGLTMVNILGVRIADEDVSATSDNDDPLSIKLSLDVMNIIGDETPSIIERVSPF